MIIIKMSKIFQWYKHDFGEEDIDVLKYISSFCSGELLENIQKILIGGKMFTVVYNEYDWSANYKKKPSKKDPNCMEEEETQMTITSFN